MHETIAVGVEEDKLRRVVMLEKSEVENPVIQLRREYAEGGEEVCGLRREGSEGDI